MRIKIAFKLFFSVFGLVINGLKEHNVFYLVYSCLVLYKKK